MPEIGCGLPPPLTESGNLAQNPREKTVPSFDSLEILSSFLSTDVSADRRGGCCRRRSVIKEAPIPLSILASELSGPIIGLGRRPFGHPSEKLCSCTFCLPDGETIVNFEADSVAARLGSIGTVYRDEPYQPAILVLYLVWQTKIVVFVLTRLGCIGKVYRDEPYEPPILVLFLVWRTKIVVSVLTLRSGRVGTVDRAKS